MTVLEAQPKVENRIKENGVRYLSINKPKINFRNDINALRALSILGVIFYHYKVEFFSGGYSGVDVFFVVSGYLMSKIITTSINRNEFSLRKFYESRLKRTVPALLFLILVLTVVCFFLYLPEEYKTIQKYAAGSIAFLSNILYLQNSNYFDPASDTNALLHTWSLSVEWQFYILYPIALLILTKVFKRRSAYVIFFVSSTIIIFLISVVLSNFEPTASFFLFPTRSWEMLLGGIAFLAENRIKDYRWKKTIAIIGYISIIACFLLLKTSMSGLITFNILPAIAAFLVIVANYNESVIIKHESTQFIGRISYSLYLWHWPIIVIAQYMGVHIDFGTIILFFLLSIVLAYLSFKYIETVKFKSSKLIVVSITFLIGTATLSSLDTNQILFKSQTLKIANYGKIYEEDIKKQMSTGKCFMTSGHAGLKDFNIKSCLYIEKDKKNVLMIGDSHGAHLSESLRESLAKRNINLMQATSSGGYPTINSNGEARFKEVMNYIYFDFIPKNADKIDGVIISAHWAKDNDINPDALLKNINETLTYLRKYHIKTIIIGQSEVYNIAYSTIVAKEHEYNLKDSNKHLNDHAYEINDYLSKNLKPYYVSIINFNSFPPLSSDNVPYMVDKNHFTKYGADLTTHKILSNSLAKSLF